MNNLRSYKVLCPFLKNKFNISTQIGIESSLVEQFGNLCPFIQKKSTETKNQCIYNAEPQLSKCSKCPRFKENQSKQILTTGNFYSRQLDQSLEMLKLEGNYREFKSIQKQQNSKLSVQIQGKEVTIWCNNDYLGLSQSQQAINKAIETIKSQGTGSGGTRNIGGTNLLHRELEYTIAGFQQQEDALLFSSCFVANQGVLNALKKIFPEIVYISDQKNHASIIEGIKNSRARKIIFPHNDVIELERQLKQLQRESVLEEKHIPKCIIFESVYSMSGNIGKIKEIIKLAKKYGCLTMIDEVHAIGLYGKRGSGICEVLGVQNQIDLTTGTLSKGIGSYGGYVAGSRLLMDAIRSFSQNFIFTSSLPPGVCAASKENIETVMSSEGVKLRKNIHNIALYIKQQCRKNNIPIIENETHIIPVLIRDAFLVKEASKMLFDKYGIYLQPINYPTVDKGQEILRISPSAIHTQEMAQELIYALKQVFRTLRL